MIDKTEFIVEVKYSDQVKYYGFPNRQGAQGFADEIKSKFPDSEIRIASDIVKSNIPSKVYDSVEDFELKKQIKISFCKKCGSSEYILESVGGQNCFICARCGNDTFT